MTDPKETQYQSKLELPTNGILFFGASVVVLIVLAIVAAVQGIADLSLLKGGADTRFLPLDVENPPNGLDIINHLLLLTFFAALIERATEVHLTRKFANAMFEATCDYDALNARITDLRNRLERVVEATLPEGLPASTVKKAETARAEKIATTHQTMLELEEQRDALKPARDKNLALVGKNKARAAAACTTLLGGLVAISGVGVFDVLDVTMPNDPNWQTAFFNLAGIVLTAFVLAGGADGIHKMIDRWGVFDSKAKSVRDQMQ